MNKFTYRLIAICLVLLTSIACSKYSMRKDNHFDKLENDIQHLTNVALKMSIYIEDGIIKTPIRSHSDIGVSKQSFITVLNAIKSFNEHKEIISIFCTKSIDDPLFTYDCAARALAVFGVYSYEYLNNDMTERFGDHGIDRVSLENYMREKIGAFAGCYVPSSGVPDYWIIGEMSTLGVINMGYVNGTLMGHMVNIVGYENDKFLVTEHLDTVLCYEVPLEKMLFMYERLNPGPVDSSAVLSILNFYHNQNTI